MNFLSVIWAFISFILGVIVALCIRYFGDYPFPWEYRLITKKQSEPDSQAIAESFYKTPIDGELHLVMGNVSHKVVMDQNVIKAVEACREKNIAIKLIHGPNIDPKSEKFISLLKNYPKTELYSLPKSPKLHFRVIITEKKTPQEVYVEEPHRPFSDIGYRHIKSKRIAREYDKLFTTLLERAAQYYP
ncbi:MAG: hypothetical protein QXN63_01315 [Candidatus Bathyarchaeia archaeon]